MVRVSQLQIVDVEVQADKDNADGRVEGGPGGKGDKVGGEDIAPEREIGAADIGDRFRGEFGFDARFTEDEDGAAGGR